MYLAGVGVVDHIPAQNQAGADLAAIVSQFQAARSAGSLTAELAAALASRAANVGMTFYNYTRTIGGDRALRGGDEILALSRQIAADIKAAAPAASTAPVSAPTATTPQAPVYTATAPTAPSATGYPSMFSPGGAPESGGSVIQVTQRTYTAPAAPGMPGPQQPQIFFTGPEAPESPLTAPEAGALDYLPYILGGLAVAYLARRKGNAT